MTGADYPRKRTAIACEVCRARRSKCDARKPACSKCVELEVECVYRRPNLWDREPATAVATTALGKVDDRLNDIQDSIVALTDEVGSIARSQSRSAAPVDHSSPLAFSPPTISSFDVANKPYQGKAGPPSYGSLSSTPPHGHRMPNILSFVSPHSLGPFSYDSAQEFFTGEMGQGDRLFGCMEDALLEGIQANFAPQTCWRLQRAFVTGFLPWMPVFDTDTCLHHVRVASTNNFSDDNPSTCLALLIFAMGAMALDEDLYKENPTLLPGFHYLALGYRILKTMRRSMGDVKHLQARCLFSAYLTFAMRPLQSWNEINSVSRECIALLKTNWKSSDSATAELKRRAYWVAYLIENELEVCLELPSSGIRTCQERLPLPSSPVEEEGLYSFLALISLRKLLAEVIETIGFKSGHAIYVPIVAVELRNQILSWHNHLPSSLQFPLDASPLFDLRKAHLRSQLFCLASLVYWPFVLRHVEDTANSDRAEQSESTAAERAAVHERAKECIESCILHLKASDGIMMQKTMASHSAVRAYYAVLMVLLIAYQAVHHCSPPPDVVQLIEHSLDIISLWEVVPFMRDPIHRLRCFAAEVSGISTITKAQSAP